MHHLDSSINCSSVSSLEVERPAWRAISASAYEQTVTAVKNVVNEVVEHPVESVTVGAAVLAGLYFSRFQIGRMLGVGRATQVAGSLLEATGVSALERKALGRRISENRKSRV